MKACLKQYGLEEENTIDFSHGCNSMQELTKEINQRMITPIKNATKNKDGTKKTPPDNYILIFLFASHGILKDGTTHVVINEFEENNNFFKLYPAE